MQKVTNMNWWMAVAGIWTAVAPFALSYTHITAALWNDRIVGVAVVVLAAASALTTNENSIQTMHTISAMLGLWLVLAPFILGYAVVTAALWNGIIAGITILALSVWVERELPPAVGHGIRRPAPPRRGPAAQRAARR
jgi:hypothetical protein